MQIAQEIKITTQTHVEEIVVDVQPGLLPEDVEVRAEGHRVFLKSTILLSLLAQETNPITYSHQSKLYRLCHNKAGGNTYAT